MRNVKLAVAVAAVSGVVALTSCSPYAGNPRGRRVAITGDSITGLMIAYGNLTEELATDYRYTLRARNGRRIDEMLANLATQVYNVYGRPDAAIVYLGTNDVVQENPNWRASFDRMLALLAPVPCVVLVTVNTYTDAHIGVTTKTATGINAAIDEAVAANPTRIHKIAWNVDWPREFTINDPQVPHYYSVRTYDQQHPNGFYTGDGVHPSPEGDVQLVSLYTSALETDCFAEMP